jgi:hypothetical protein
MYCTTLQARPEQQQSWYYLLRICESFVSAPMIQ